MNDEFEIIRHQHILHMNLFAVTIDYRNPHFHRDFELNLILAGEGTLRLGEQAYPLRPGGLLVINPNEAHEIRTDGGVTILCIQISPQLLRAALPAMDRLSFDAVSLDTALSAPQLDDLRGLAVELACQHTLCRPAWQLLCAGLLEVLVCYLLRHLPLHLLTDDEYRSIKNRTHRLTRIMEQVERRYAEKLLLTDLARGEGVSMGHLSHFIRDNLGQSFQEYLASVRFYHAKALVLSGRRLIDVCVDTGFSDPRYLTRAFLRYEGCTPQEYRRRHPTGSHREGIPADRPTQRYLNTGEMLDHLRPLRAPLGPLLDSLLQAGPG